MPKPNHCQFCGRDIEALEEHPLVVYVAAYRIGGPGYYDRSLVPDWVHHLASKPVPRVEMCTDCAAVRIPFQGNAAEIHPLENLNPNPEPSA